MKILYVTNGDDKYGAASSLKELIQLEMGMDNIEIEVLNTEHNGLNKWCDERKIKNYSFKYLGTALIALLNVYYYNDLLKMVAMFILYLCITEKYRFVIGRR